MSKSDPKSSKSCNRRPFLSGDGCDRGNVDIHQFDDFPYCESFDPTMPAIPPEIVDTPLQIPVPPSCACVNIKYALKFKYSQNRKFEASASFSAQGDCCEGNYVSNFNLQIPCPILGSGAKRLKMKISYGTGRNSVSASYIKTNADSCTVEAKDVDINLNIPCPIKDARGKKIKIGISYGEGDKTASASFLRTDTKNCEIEPLSPNLKLNLPCPIVGRKGTPKIKASIKYGNGDSKASASYINADPKECTIEPLSPSINLNIPCPIKDARGKKIKIGISYGNGKKEVEASFLKTDPDKCTVEALAPTFNLNLPCPVRRQQNTPKIKAKIGWGNRGASASASLLSVNVASCEIQAKDVNLNLNLPCPIRSSDHPPKLKAKIGWGSTGRSASVSILTADPNSCEIRTADATLSLNLPCPITKDVTSKIYIKPKIGNAAGTVQNVDFITLSKANCTVDANDVTLDIAVPCPITTGTKTIKINALKLGTPAAVTQNLATLSNCNVSMNSPEFTLNVPCALKGLSIIKGTMKTQGSTGDITITKTTTPSDGNCTGVFKIDVTFPKGGTTIDEEVITDMKYEGHTLKVRMTKFKDGNATHRWKTVFTAVSHKSDHTCCNDA